MLRDRRGAIAIMVAVGLPALLGLVGLAVDLGIWYREQSRLQLAADAAAMGAARLLPAKTATQSDLQQAGLLEAQAVSVDNTIGHLRTPISATAAADWSTVTVTLTSSADRYFTSLIGVAAPTLTATAVVTTPMPFCLTALASSGTTPAITTSGAPKADLTGCNIMSNTDANCNGHDLDANIGAAHGNSSGCGLSQVSGAPTVKDPYSRLAASIPANPCTSYPQKPVNKGGTALPASNLWSGNKTLSGTNTVCGDLQLTGNVTVDASPSGVLVIQNGQLDTNGYTLKTTSGSALTVIFSGSNGSYIHAPTGGGTLDIAAPTSGTWSGIALYQDPSLTTGVDIAAAGNSPTWNLTGLVYLPHASVTFSGAVNKSSNGGSCFAMVVDHVTLNGTAAILARGGCAAAGLTLPSNPPQLTL